MSLQLTLIVLAAAAMHALWNAFIKASGDKLVELAVLNVTAGIIGLALVPLAGFPGWDAAPYLAGTMLCHAGYYTFLIVAYDHGGLSLVYPIARGASPVLVAAFSGSLLGEDVHAGQWAAIALITAGIAALAFAGKREALHGRAVLAALTTGLTIAAYTMVDGAGARAATSALAYIATLFVLNGLILVPVVWLRRPSPKIDWKRGAFSGALSIGAYGLAIWAMTRGSIALVAALRETSVVMAALIGTLFLGEPLGRVRVAASVSVALGIVALRFYG